MSDIKKQNLNIFIILIMLITALLEFAYGLFYLNTSVEGRILIQETIAFFIVQVLLYSILKITRVLALEHNLNICIGVLGLAHSVFMAFLVAQRIATSIKTTLFVFLMFVILQLFMVLFSGLLFKRYLKKKRQKTKISKKTQSKISCTICFAGVFLGMFLFRVLDKNIIIFDVLIFGLSITYTAFYFVLKRPVP